MSPPQDHDYFSGPEFIDYTGASTKDWATANAMGNDSLMSAANSPPDFPNQDVASFGMYSGPAPSSNAGAFVMYDTFTPAESIGLGSSQSLYTGGMTNGLIGTNSLGNGDSYQSSGNGGRFVFSCISIANGFEGLSDSIFNDIDPVTVNAGWSSAHANSNNVSAEWNDASIDLNLTPSPTISNNAAGLAGVTSIPDLPEFFVSAPYSEHAYSTVPSEPTAPATPSKPAANTGLRNVSGTPEELPLEYVSSNTLSESVNTANAPVSSNVSPAGSDSQGWEFVDSNGSDFDDGTSIYSISSQGAEDNNAHTPDASDASGEDLVDNTGGPDGHDNTDGLDNSNHNASSIDHVVGLINDQGAENRPQWTYAADPLQAYFAEIIEEQKMKMASSSSHTIHILDDGEDGHEVVKGNTRGSQSSGHVTTANTDVSPYANASDFNNRTPENNSCQFNSFVQHQSNHVGGQQSNNMPGAYAREHDQSVPQHSSPMRPTQNRQSAKSRRERRSSSPLRSVPSPRSPPRPVKPRQVQTGPSRAGPSQAYAAQFRPAQGCAAQFQPAQGHPSQVGISQAGTSQARSFQAGPSQAGQSRGRPSQARPSLAGPSRAGPSQAGPSRAHQSFASPQLALYAPASSSVDAPAHHVQSKSSAQVNRKRKSIDEANFDTLDVQQAHGNGVPTTFSDPAYSTSDLYQMTLNYQPVYDFTGQPEPPNALAPIYAPYAGHFATSAEAKEHRKRIRHTPQQKNIKDTADLYTVKLIGRPFWVRRLYNAMIDVSCITDSESSIHRNRFAVTKAFDEKDIEAAAHKIFDEALAVHERGWNKPIVYYKKVHRGKLQDQCLDSVEKRLALICKCLSESKAAVDDALRGGITLALVCDNPIARGGTKQSNNAGNARRGERLKMVRDATAAAASGSGSAATTPASATAQTMARTAPAFPSTSAPGPSMSKRKGRAVEPQEEEFEGEFEDDDAEWQHAQDGGELYGNEMFGMEQYGWGGKFE